MMSDKKHLGVRIDPDLHYAVRFVASIRAEKASEWMRRAIKNQLVLDAKAFSPFMNEQRDSILDIIAGLNQESKKEEAEL